MISNTNYVLPAGVNSLTLGGTANLIGIGNGQANTLIGNAGNNILAGGAGNDTIYGGDGFDILLGEAGTDQIYGGGGTDVFVLGDVAHSRPGAGRDVIHDFTVGVDVLHLTGIVPGMSISHLGTAAFKLGAATVQTRLMVVGNDSILQIDIPNGGRTDGIADAEILLRGVQSLPSWSIVDAVAAPVAPTPPSVPPAPPPIVAPPPAVSPPVASLPDTSLPDTARTVYIDPSARTSGDGSVNSPFNSWAGRTVQADTSYLIKAGTVINGVVVVKGYGTEDAPIVIGSYGSGAPPVIQGSIAVENAAHVTIAGLSIVNSSFAGVALQGGARDITILNNTIQNTSIGVWVGREAGGGNVIEGNTISNSQLHGVAFDKADHSGNATRVVDNVIRDAGSHGIAINASGMVVDGNDVGSSGGRVSGSSGIHVYGGYGTPDGFGKGNVISNNRVHDTREAGNGYDGNGIQADQYTSGNRIQNNTVYGNDGAGILLYDSASNLVTGNTLTGNVLDRSGQHPYRGEILLAADIDVRSELTRGNVIQNNKVTTTDATTTAFWMDPNTADNGNVFGGNTVVQQAGGSVYAYGGIYGTVGSDRALWNTVLAPGGGDDVWG